MKLVTTAILVFLLTVFSAAIDIRSVYVPPGGNALGVITQAGPVDLVPVVEAATRAWNDQIGDNWTISIYYGWSNSISPSIGQYYGQWMPFGDQRHIQGRILFNPDYAWYADSTPYESSEYGTYTETNVNYGGGEANVGRVYTNPNAEAAGKFDLLTVATHEVGHSLSVGVGSLWTNETADGDVDLRSPRWFDGSSVPIDAGNPQHLLASTSLMWYGVAPGERRLISDIDREVAMQVSNFTVRSVPEPISLAVIAVGLAALIRKRR